MKHIVKTLVEFVGRRFEYTTDGKMPVDPWFVMKLKAGKFKGDCDDFTITCLWYICGTSLWRFIRDVIILEKYEIHRVKTVNGGFHVVGKVDGLWFDNWTLEALPEEEFFEKTGHRHLHQYTKYDIVPRLISGLFYKRILRR